MSVGHGILGPAQGLDLGISVMSRHRGEKSHLFQNDSTQAVHKEYNGPLTASPSFYFKRTHETDTMR